MFKTTGLYLENINSTANIVVNQGGTSSGKTYAIMQVLFSIAVSEPNVVITVVGQDIPNLKVGALRDALEIYNNSEELKCLVKSYNKTDRVFEFVSGSLMEFKSYGDAQDAKSGKRDYAFLNEANGIKYEIYNEIALRTRKRVFLDYNPNVAFWVHENLIGREGVQLIISDHRHNPFLPQIMRDKIEALKDVDLDLWKVYARGMTGKVEGLILRNWVEIDSVPKEAQLIGYGLDFGFTNDPTACVGVFRYNSELILDEVLYQANLTNPDIAKELKGKVSGWVVADSAEPKSIKELQNEGMQVEAARKGQDSIINSIDVLKRFRLNVTRSSVNLKKELNTYKWKVDKKSGKTVNEPVDFMNHAIDAIRYVALNRLAHKNSGQVKFT
jgi:phage terminase large subunit